MRKKIILMISFFMFLSGCFFTGNNVKEHDLDLIDLKQITESLHENYGKLRSVSGRFDFSYSTASDKKQSGGYLYITKNDTVYIEINGLVGETEAVFFMDKDSLKAVNYFNKTLVIGKSDINSVKRITGMDITSTELKSSLLCYDTAYTPLKIINRDSEKIVFRIELNDKEYQFVTVNKNLLITEISEYFERDLKFKREYDYFSYDNGHVMPKRIRVRTYNPPSKLTIFYTKLNIDENPADFSEVSL